VCSQLLVLDTRYKKCHAANGGQHAIDDVQKHDLVTEEGGGGNHLTGHASGHWDSNSQSHNLAVSLDLCIAGIPLGTKISVS
jgi:hypothetical protein